MNVQAKEFFDSYWQQLTPLFEEQEAKSVIFLLIESYFGISKTDILVNKEVTVDLPDLMSLAVRRLLQHEPVQYILGFAWFMDRQFKVSDEVLIPRQETEELVLLILDQGRWDSLKILDIGTGSGIIPISLKLENPNFEVSGLDISLEALDIATWNASVYQVQAKWYQMDILLEGPTETFDMIVSNPPYVMEKEKANMSPNVLNYDPGLALFVPNDDPLLFYRKITEYASKHLTDGGRLYFEINEALGKETASLIGSFGFQDVTIHQDLNGKDRMISAVKR